MNSDKLRAACLAATLATAWMAPVAAEAAAPPPTTTVEIRGLTSLTWLSVRVIALGSGSGGGYDFADLGAVPAGFVDRRYVLSGGVPLRFVAIGANSGPDIFITTDLPNLAIGKDFDSLFDIPAGTDGTPGTDFDEALIAADIRSASNTPLISAFVQRLDDLGCTSLPAVQCTCTHFSSGVDAGNLTFSLVVPEPASAAVVMLGGAGLLHRRRKS